MIDRRKRFRIGLATEYLHLYDGLCALLDNKWQPYRGKCTIEAQDALYAQGRTAPGEIVTNAKGLESPHPHGCASDWAIFDDKGHPVWPHKEDPIWNEYTTAIWKVGLRSGSEFGDIDHNELMIQGKWKDYKQGELK
jgi:hypothetical protein